MRLDEFRQLVNGTTKRVQRDSSAKAILSRSLGRTLDQAPRAIPLIAAWLPATPTPETDDALLFSAAVAARYPSLHKSGARFGTALVHSGDRDLAARRLTAATRADSVTLLSRHLPDLVRIVATANEQTDLAVLGWQAATWTTGRDETARQWLRDFYRSATSPPTPPNDPQPRSES